MSATTSPLRRSPMNPQLLPAQLRSDAPAWTQTVIAFLAEK